MKKILLMSFTMAFVFACGDKGTENKVHQYVEIPNVNMQSWDVTPSAYEYVMTMTAVVFVDGESLSSPDNLLAVFSGNELRGVATPYLHQDEAIFDLMIYSNSLDEMLTFGLWIQEMEKAVEIAEEIHFVSGEAMGSPDTPYILNIK